MLVHAHRRRGLFARRRRRSPARGVRLFFLRLSPSRSRYVGCLATCCEQFPPVIRPRQRQPLSLCCTLRRYVIPFLCLLSDYINDHDYSANASSTRVCLSSGDYTQPAYSDCNPRGNCSVAFARGLMPGCQLCRPGYVHCRSSLSLFDLSVWLLFWFTGARAICALAAPVRRKPVVIRLFRFHCVLASKASSIQSS